MTVPLLIQGQVIGTFNVESLDPRAFNETDLHYLEAFAQDVALAVNTMDLFVLTQPGGVGDFILGEVSRLDAFSVYLVRT